MKTIIGNHVFKSFDLYESYINLIDQIFVDASSKWQPFNDAHVMQFCFILIQSEVSYLRSSTISNCHSIIQNSHLDQILALEANQMEISRTTIGAIVNQGMNIKNDSSLIMTDVHISHLHRDSVVLCASCKLILVNVSIDCCDAPCFNIPRSADYSFDNVFINKEKVENTTHRAFMHDARLKIFQNKMKDEIKFNMITYDQVS